MTPPTMKQTLDLYRREMEAFFANCLLEESIPSSLARAMRYSLMAGGKRVRPILCLVWAEHFGRPRTDLVPFAASLELIHTYSLIHDDLPALDNDDLRRGKPTNHRVFGDDMAILAGDALLTLAFEALAGLGRDPSLSPARILAVVAEIAGAAGVGGMVGGQVVDVKSEGKQVDRKVLEYIHTHKTGALIRASVRSGCLLAGAPAPLLGALTVYAEKLGLAFQIIDDYLDETGDERALGKRVGGDKARRKATYTSLVGREASLREAEGLHREAVASLKPIPKGTEILQYLAHKLVYRDR